MAETADERPEATPSHRRRFLADVGFEWVIIGLLVLATVLRGPLSGLVEGRAFQNWTTITVALVLQAVPFLVLGAAVSGAIAAFVPAGAVARALPRNDLLAVPAASLAGGVLPGCECGSVPVAGRLVQGGARPPAAFAFMLSAPAINPVVLVSTAVAFPGRPDVVLARFLASLATAIVVGWAWSRWAGSVPLRRMRPTHHHGSRMGAFADTTIHDFLHAAGFLVIGAGVAGLMQTVVPRSVLDHVASTGVLAVATMAVLAFVLALCSEADAFIAASLTQFSLTSRLVFLVVGPAVDVKLVALQAGTFGRGFAWRFAPLTFVVAVASALVVGWWVL